MQRLFRRGRVWYGWFYENGQRVTKTTHYRDRSAAERVARQWERDAADPDHAAARTATLTDALQLLLRLDEEEVKAGRRSADTVGFHRTKAGHLVRVFETDEHEQHVPFPLTRLRAFDVDGYISRRRAEGAADTTVSKELVVLRKSLRLAIRAGLWRGRVEEVILVAFSPGYEPRKRALTADELKKLLAELLPDRARPTRRRRRGARDCSPARHEAEDALPHGSDRKPSPAIAPRLRARAREGHGRHALPALGQRAPRPRRCVRGRENRALFAERPPAHVRELAGRGRRAALPDRPGDGTQGHADAGAGLRPPDARAAGRDDGARNGFDAGRL